MQSFQTFERASKELARLRNELLEFEKRIKDLRESLHSSEWELLSHNCQRSTSPEDKLVARIAEEVVSRLALASKDSGSQRKQYVREREAAEYMGVSVSALRSWRTKRSKNGPPYSRLGRMVLYSVC
jgi:hypothetical protein